MEMDKDCFNYCRICLDVECKHVSIFADPIVSLQIKSCLDMVVSVEDNLPKDICETCLSQLSNFYNFKLNARCSLDWLESSLQEKRKSNETKHVHPLPDSEYNSDSLLEFLNNTENIDEYLNNLGKEDIPVIVNMLDRTEANSLILSKKQHWSPKKNNELLDMNIDVLDSDKDVVKEIIMKDAEPIYNSDQSHSCFGCKTVTNSIQELSHHLSICDNASRTCVLCRTLFDSKQKMLQHILTHNITAPMTCTCGKLFKTKEMLISHAKYCNIDHIASMGFAYRCKKCGLMFPERFQLYKHAKKHILPEEQQVCDICGHIFIGYDALVKHRKQQHERTVIVKYRCKKCSYSTTVRKEMYIHIRKHSELKDSKHLCETCGRCFASQVTLLRHMVSHNNINCTLEVRKEKINGFHLEMVMCDKCGNNINRFELSNHSCV